MNDNGKQPDPVESAIDAVAAKPVQVEMRQYNLTSLATGRPSILVVPTDASDTELAEIAGFLLTQTRADIAKARTQTPSGLQIVRGPLPKGNGG